MQQSASQSALIIAIATGSAVGGVLRYLLTAAVDTRSGSAFPFGTLFVNITGCLLLGILGQMILSQHDFSPVWRVLLTTGFCGGFTTFSAFAFEAVRAVQDGAWQRAVGYVATSLVAGLAALWIGMSLARLLFGATARAS